MSNTERQRRFRERNPGYYGRLHARRKGESAAVVQPSHQAVAAVLMLPAPREQDPLLAELAAAKLGAKREAVEVA